MTAYIGKSSCLTFVFPYGILGAGFPLSTQWLNAKISFSTRVGIIGAPRNKFNPHTLLPIVMLEDEKEDEEPRASAASLCSPELTSATMRSTQGSVNQACVAVSRATTEGDYPENPQ